jgi:hypothetical protein
VILESGARAPISDLISVQQSKTGLPGATTNSSLSSLLSTSAVSLSNGGASSSQATDTIGAASASIADMLGQEG